MSCEALHNTDGENTRENTQAAIRYGLDNPLWKLSLQAHKIAGIP